MQDTSLTTLPVAIESQQQFNQQVATENFVVLLFTATWCEPCQVFYPVFAAAAEQHPDIRFVTVDIDVATDLTANFQVKQVPALMVVRDRVVIDMVTGAMHADELQHHIQMWQTMDMTAINAHFEHPSAAA